MERALGRRNSMKKDVKSAWRVEGTRKDLLLGMTSQRCRRGRENEGG